MVTSYDCFHHLKNWRLKRQKSEEGGKKGEDGGGGGRGKGDKEEFRGEVRKRPGVISNVRCRHR